MLRKHLAWAVVAVLLSPSALAEDNQTVWRCWYEGRGAVACAVQQVATTPGTSLGESLSPLTPEILRTIRNTPSSLIGRFILIPLHTLPFDNESVARLAQLTVCGSRSDCRMNYSATRPSDIDLAALMDGDTRY